MNHQILICIPHLLVETEINMNAMERLNFYAKKLEAEAPAIIPSNRPPPEWPSRGEIAFDNIQMR